MNYALLKKSLDLKTAITWLAKDSKDDFFPDPICWADICKFPDEFLARREHRILQANTLPHIKEYVPKKSGMLREAVWLHPSHRILYLAILHRVLPRLDSKLCAESYSYRADNSANFDAYPFEKKMDRWKDFHNDFRRSALESNTGAILITDLASYFDHISILELIKRIESILADTMDDGDHEVINFASSLLRMWGCGGFGMPHNLDASSFLSNVYLHNVDYEMSAKRYRYFRWVDDMRIVTKSKVQALRALHDLQRTLAQHRLFLATDKTWIHEKNSDKFNELLDVEDDLLIARAEEAISCSTKNDLEAIADELFPRLTFHASQQGDDRKFRAFANRLLDISDFAEVKREITSQIRQFVIPRLKTHPDRSDYWAKMLAACPNSDVGNALKDLLVDDPSLFDWQRFHLWKLATQLPTGLLPRELFGRAREVNSSTLSENVAAQSIVFLGRHSDNTERENIYARLFSAQRSYVVQRAILIGIQELPSREDYYHRALETNADHQELVDYLLQCEKPNYGIKIRASRTCKEEPKPIKQIIKRGIGMAHGRITTFRLCSSDYDY